MMSLKSTGLPLRVSKTRVAWTRILSDVPRSREAKGQDFVPLLGLQGHHVWIPRSLDIIPRPCDISCRVSHCPSILAILISLSLRSLVRTCWIWSCRGETSSSVGLFFFAPSFHLTYFVGFHKTILWKRLPVDKSFFYENSHWLCSLVGLVYNIEPSGCQITFFQRFSQRVKFFTNPDISWGAASCMYV